MRGSVFALVHGPAARTPPSYSQAFRRYGSVVYGPLWRFVLSEGTAIRSVPVRTENIVLDRDRVDKFFLPLGTHFHFLSGALKPSLILQYFSASLPDRANYVRSSPKVYYKQ